MRIHESRRERGAALIIAIAIMTILLAIALTFFAVTRLELKTATNVTNTVRVEFLAESGVAMAVASLNQDFLAHPAVSSNDHPWRTLYNGAAFAGKPWAWRNGVPISSGGVPQVDLNRFPYVDVDGDGIIDEPLYRGPRTRNWLFIPRMERVTRTNVNPAGKFTPVLYSRTAALYTADGTPVDLEDPASPYRFVRYEQEPALADGVDSLSPSEFPFVTPRFYKLHRDVSKFFGLTDDSAEEEAGRYDAEMVDLWADVDNNGDGLKDSMWIPIPIDRFLPDDGIDNDLDGAIDEQQDNEINEDPGPGDGGIDFEPCDPAFCCEDASSPACEGCIDTDGDGCPDLRSDPDEAIEAGAFIYYTGDDGLDNDSDGLIDRDDSPANPAASAPYEFDPLYDPLDPPTGPIGNAGDSKLGFMLSTPILGMRIPIDLDADGIIGDADDYYWDVDPEDRDKTVQYQAEVILPATLTVQFWLPNGDTVPLTFTEADVDTIDNDYDLLVNNTSVYAYLGPRQDPWRPEGNWDPDDRAAYETARGLAYHDICTQCYFPELYETNLLPDAPPNLPANVSTEFRLRITFSGEPACDLAGRAAVLITDEQSKVNLNAAGGYAFNARSDSPAPDLNRTIADGVSPYEYETRALPGIGVDLAPRFWGLLTGAPEGRTLLPDDLGPDLPGEADPYTLGFHYDVSLPGYGRVDDNGNSLVLALNGLNDNADQDFGTGGEVADLADEGLRLPRLSPQMIDQLNGAVDDPAVDQELRLSFVPYFRRLGFFEGIDEPGELQRFRPLRNELAERDQDALDLDEDGDLTEPLDNNRDSSSNEIGELGDRNLRTREQVTMAEGIGDVRFETLKNLITVHSTDKNVKYVETLSGVKTLNKLDFNRATAQQIAAWLLLNGKFVSVTKQRLLAADAPPNATGTRYLGGTASTPEGKLPFQGSPAEVDDGTTRFFADALLQADTEVIAPEWDPALGVAGTGGLLFADSPAGPVPTTHEELGHRLPADPVLAAMQTAADAVDSRDGDHARTVLTTEKADLIPDSEFNGVPWPDSVIISPRDQVPSEELLNLEDIEDYAGSQLEMGDVPPFQFIDRWWATLVMNQPLPSAADPDPDFGQESRRISYTASGSEAIRINEIMVRPVRRVEAEATPDKPNFGAAYRRELDPSPYTTPDDPVGFPPSENRDYYNGRYPNGSVVSGNVIQSETPEFIMKRQDMDSLGLTSTVNWFAPTEDAGLGENTFLATDRFYTDTVAGGVPDNPQVNVPNAMEYLFVASEEGLPEGRYYLTMNVTSQNGAMSITKDNQLRYAIKYVPVIKDSNGNISVISGFWKDLFQDGLYPNATTILEDIRNAAPTAVDNTAIDTDRRDWWKWIEAPGNSFRADLFGMFAPVSMSDMALGNDRRRAGWVFLDGSPIGYAEPMRPHYDPTVPQAVRVLGYYEDALRQLAQVPFAADANVDYQLACRQLAAYGPLAIGGDTLTVLVPPFPDRRDPVTGEILPEKIGFALYVAVMLDLEASDPNAEMPSLAVNFFDFSQEPDHEWVELVNVSDETVDLSDWTLEVGIPQVAGADPDPNLTSWQISEPVKIAPGGMILLTPNKFDEYQNANLPTTNKIKTNGIGLARGVLPYADPAAAFNYAVVTVPSFIDQASTYYGDSTGPYPLRGDYPDVTGSIFDRLGVNDEVIAYVGSAGATAVPALEQFQPFAVDYLDTQGDGLNDLVEAIQSNGPVPQDAKLDTTQPLAGLSTAPWRDKAWDRIVQLTPKNQNFGNDRAAIVQLVLQGGIFPNYPENDGIDNDGDGPYLPTGAPLGVRGVLGRDLVDNDLDGRIDELDEGVDEGRLAAAGAYGPGTLPCVFFRSNGVQYDLAMTAYGDEGIDATPSSPLYSTEFQGSFVARMGYDPDALAAGELNASAPYVGSDFDPPAWKAFVQRRWNPGDDVIITLYEGAADQKRVADRVTYSELDVVNRNVDDIRPNPYPTGLNADYPTFWTPNHMALDFYKSLERKHPLAKGDRFGTQNRWQATDGNYDDWAESLLPWERLVDGERWPYRLNRATAASDDGVVYRFSPALPEEELAFNEQMFRHALSGSPLRMNAAARLADNPALPDGTHQFAVRTQFTVPWPSDEFPNGVAPNQGWAYSEMQFRSRDFASPGDLLRLPRVTTQIAMFNPLIPGLPDVFPWLNGPNSINAASVPPGGAVTHEDRTLRSAVLGQAPAGSLNEALVKQAADVFSGSSITLTMAQADYSPIAPSVNVVEPPPGVDENEPEQIFWWRQAGSSLLPPYAWAPLYLFEMPGVDGIQPVRYAGVSGGYTTALTQRAYLMNRAFFVENPAWTDANSQYTAEHYAARWPMQRRIVAYVTDRFNPDPDVTVPNEYHPEALFEWGPEDGLENGDYILYIGTFLPGLREALIDTDKTIADVVDAFNAASDVTGFLQNMGYPDWLRAMRGGSPAVEPTVYGVVRQPDASILGAPAGLYLPDPLHDRMAISQDTMTMALEVEVFTERARTGGALVSPAEWSGTILRPRPDGYMLYGEAGQEAWRPRIVTVRNNYLALRVRNLSPPGQPNMLTQVVLAPRRSTPGRINVNTAAMSLREYQITGTTRHELFSPLMGLPGIVDAMMPAGPSDPIDPPTYNTGEPAATQPWTIPSVVASTNEIRFVPPARRIPDDEGNVRDESVLDDAAGERTAALQLTGMILEGRPEHYDGRYYESPVELALDGSEFDIAPDPDADFPADYIFPLSNEDDPQVRFEEMSGRFRRMANLLTTRSDLYEIIVTAQSGYGIDMDNDGFINYRSNDEFVTTAETKVRSVYERRSPRPAPEPPPAP